MQLEEVLAVELVLSRLLGPMTPGCRTCAACGVTGADRRRVGADGGAAGAG